MQPFIFAEMLVTRGKGQLSGVAIKGIDPSLVGGVLDLKQHMLEGSVESLAAEPQPGVPPPIIMGKELAHKLKAKVGDDVTVVVPLSNIDFDTWRAKSSAPRTRRFHVTGIFYSGFDEYDRRLMYTSLADTQELVGRGDRGDGRRDEGEGRRPRRGDRGQARGEAGRPAVPGAGLVRAQPQPVHGARAAEVRAGDHPDAHHYCRRGEHGLGADDDGHRQDARDRDPEVDGGDARRAWARCSRWWA